MTGTCGECSADWYTDKPVSDCPHCGAKEQVACISCHWWEIQETSKCVGCVKGNNFKSEDES